MAIGNLPIVNADQDGFIGIEIDEKEFRDLMRKFDPQTNIVEAKAKARIRTMLARIGQVGVENAKFLAPEYDPGDWGVPIMAALGRKPGRLKNSFRAEGITRAGFQGVIVGSDEEHSRYVSEGTGVYGPSGSPIVAKPGHSLRLEPWATYHETQLKPLQKMSRDRGFSSPSAFARSVLGSERAAYMKDAVRGKATGRFYSNPPYALSVKGQRPNTYLRDVRDIMELALRGEIDNLAEEIAEDMVGHGKISHTQKFSTPQGFHAPNLADKPTKPHPRPEVSLPYPSKTPKVSKPESPEKIATYKAKAKKKAIADLKAQERAFTEAKKARMRGIQAKKKQEDLEFQLTVAINRAKNDLNRNNLDNLRNEFERVLREYKDRGLLDNRRTRIVLGKTKNIHTQLANDLQRKRGGTKQSEPRSTPDSTYDSLPQSVKNQIDRIKNVSGSEPTIRKSKSGRSIIVGNIGNIKLKRDTVLTIPLHGEEQGQIVPRYSYTRRKGENRKSRYRRLKRAGAYAPGKGSVKRQLGIKRANRRRKKK